jgi:hypothetical protein
VSFWSRNPTEKKLGLYLKWKAKKVNSLFSKIAHMTKKISEKYQFGYKQMQTFMLILNPLKWPR